MVILQAEPFFGHSILITRQDDGTASVAIDGDRPTSIFGSSVLADPVVCEIGVAAAKQRIDRAERLLRGHRQKLAQALHAVASAGAH